MKQKQKASRAGTPGPPAGSMPVVNSHRDETNQPSTKVRRDEGRFRRPDCPYLKNGRSGLRVGTWNVRTLNQLGKIENLLKEAEDMKTDILGISETRYKGEGTVRLDGYTFIYSGGDEHQHGVGFMVKSSVEKSILGYWPVSSRNIMLKLKAKPFDIAIIQTYAPTSSYDDEEVEGHYQEINKMLKEVKSTDVLLVIGDFNAKIGEGSYKDIIGAHGLGERNPRGDRLAHFCIEKDLVVTNTIFQHPKRLLYTWKSPGDISRNQIDYILIRKRFRNSVKQCKTYPGADINSDHNPLIAKISIKLKRAMPTSLKKKTSIDYGKLATPAMQEKYLIDVKNQYEVLSMETDVQETNISSSDKKWNLLKNSILHANENAPKIERKKKQIWMTDQIMNLMAERKKAKNPQEYTKIDKEIRKSCRIAKENWINQKCDQIEENQKLNGTKKMHDDIKLITGDKKNSNSAGSCIKDKEGNMIFESDKILERWAEYVGDLFADTRPPLPTPSNERGPPILKAEVQKAIKNARSGKAPGDDGITTEMLKLLEDFGVEKLTDLYNEVYSTGVFPEELLMSVYITLPKQPRATDCSNYRTISLMPHALKIFLKVIQDRISNKIDKEVGETQFGFRPGSGTREGIFCFNILAQKHIEVNEDLFTCFIDYSKAFDRVHHEQLIKCLERIGIDGKDIRIIANLYWHQKAAIRINNELSPFTSIERGVRQGCVLSPCLFNIYTEFIFRESNMLDGTKIHGGNINNLRYADDTALIANSEQKLQTIVDKVKEESAKHGLDMNVKKTKTMLISKHPEGKKIAVKVDGVVLEQVNIFKYLGTLIKNDLKTEEEIECRTNLAKAKFCGMYKVLTSKRLKMKTRLKILKSYIYSIFTYGCEAWSLSKILEEKIEIFENWCLRMMGKIQWKDRISNEKVLQILKTKRSLLENIQKRKLKYFGHIKRKGNILTTAMEGRLCGRRSRGRPRNSWFTDIKTWTGLSGRECTRLAAQRDLWSVISRRPSSRR